MPRLPTLAAARPDLAAEWEPVLNRDLGPDQITLGSDRRVWWLCTHGHRWFARVQARVTGTGCPECAGRRRGPLASELPELAAQWHPERNGSLTPVDVTQGSNRRVWWVCDRGHEWQALVYQRAQGSRCPRCTGLPPLAEAPVELIRQWHPERNGDLSPADLTQGSGRLVWWRCEAGHEWKTVVRDRVRRGDGCPACSTGPVRYRSGRPRGTVAEERPDLVPQWHPDRNGDLGPDEVTAGSGRRVWWRCEGGHEWESTPLNRIITGRNCPVCGGRPPNPGQA